jgi:hypothetical protein
MAVEIPHLTALFAPSAPLSAVLGLTIRQAVARAGHESCFSIISRRARPTQRLVLDD